MNRYNVKLDRLVSHHGVVGQCGNGMHNFVIDEIELGARVALALDAEDQAWWLLIGTPMLLEMEHGCV